MFSKMIIPILSNVQVEKPCGVEDRYFRKWKKIFRPGVGTFYLGYPQLNQFSSLYLIFLLSEKIVAPPQGFLDNPVLLSCN